MSFELLEPWISKPILDQLPALKTTIDNRAEGLGVRAAGDVVDMPEFKWDSDSKPIPCLLPEHYILPTKIHPLAMWQVWHYGASVKDGIAAVGPLKMIEPLNCPKKF